MNERDDPPQSFWAVLRRDAGQSPRLVGAALFAVALFFYGVIAFDAQAIAIALRVGAVAVGILAVPAYVVSQRSRPGGRRSS